MAFTRFHDDDARVRKQLEVMTYVGRYQMDAPGNGMNLPYLEDPQIRLQKWACNLQTNTVNLESDLLGLSRIYNRDIIHLNNYQTHAAKAKAYCSKYENEAPFVCESRAILPAWMLRGVEIPRWETPFINPQANVEKDFRDNISTRLLEKDCFVR